MFWLTGSQKFHLIKGVNETLAGRVAIIDLLGLSQSELSRNSNSRAFIPTQDWIKEASRMPAKTSLRDVYKNIWMGSFPRVHQK